MLFNSFYFLAFFGVLVLIYYALPHRFRWFLLLAASLYFYSTFNLNYVLLLVASALVAYTAGRWIQATEEKARKRSILIAGVIVSLLPLFVFKYFDFFASSVDTLLQDPLAESGAAFSLRLGWLIPAGLSFYTFSCVSYLFDVYRARLAPEKHLGNFLLYVSFFPKLLAGPIERATTFLPQLGRPVHFDSARVTSGLQLVLWGLVKKVVIADRLAPFVDAAYKNPALSSPVGLIIATYFFAFQIYCDFSGYSDIAIGAARILGFDLMENFRRPYISASVSEFWGKNRWHISLNTWFRDYMYIPLGGSQVSKPRFYLNQMIVFVVSGLWHGANWTFVIWGGLNGLYQILTLLTAGIWGKIAQAIRLPSAVGTILSTIVTFHLVLIAWVFFRAASVSDAFDVLTRVANAIPRLGTLLPSYNFSSETILSMILIAALVCIEMIDERRPLWDRLQTQPVVIRWSFYYALLIALVVLGKWGLVQFVYMAF